GGIAAEVVQRDRLTLLVADFALHRERLDRVLNCGLEVADVTRDVPEVREHDGEALGPAELAEERRGFLQQVTARVPVAARSSGGSDVAQPSRDALAVAEARVERVHLAP